MERKVSAPKTIIAILIPLLELGIGSFIARLVHNNQWLLVILNVLVFFVGFITAIILFKDVLRDDWKIWKQHIWRNLGLALLGMILTYVILSLVRMGMKPFVAGAAVNTSLLSIQTASMGLVASLTTLMAPFTEEIVFRHALFFQWKNNKVLMWIMFFVSSVAFGLVHWNNFNGDVVQMIPYMVVGAWFALIYYFSKNIWQNIMTHFLFDFVQFASAVLLLVVAFMTK
ncbi:CPBP family intramembrane glutamic endopeptidase [Pediococcus argentinicus]|uniref:Abortive infection protein n=1 Tax=Pediococcus argentinicus TaxID=480391 RepID=A0A0R2NFM5_9LACO|nr:type II CAAX endopeptidase family protein [Pediococcus argentinicus]KRO23072.1 abortive infection protein [Pediococcus argentinicus]NKZ22944.1 CPBP family intramembrane metalloprotease [Pediococcus argentinicus]GEP20015.1 hypothetical protein LSA03_13990 [Pediococcus argentinicus]